MEKQTRSNKYRNLRNQLKKESAYLDDSQVLQTAYSKGIIKQPLEVNKNIENIDVDLIEKTINEIKNDIINNPNKTPEEIEQSLRMFEERVELAKKNTSNVESIVQQINAWQKGSSSPIRVKSRVNTITNSTRSTTMLNAVNVDLTVDDLIKARQEVVEKLKSNPNSSKSSLKFEESITAKVNKNPNQRIVTKRKKSFNFVKFLSSFILTVIILSLLVGLLMNYLYPELFNDIISKFKELFV